MSVPYWLLTEYGRSLWDDFYLGGEWWPGVWKLETSKGRDTDKAKAAGIDGYTLTNKGYSGGVIKATGILWTADDIAELDVLIPRFDPETVGVSTPLDIYHPQAELLRLAAVYLKKISVTGPDRGKLVCSLDLEQWFPATKPAKSGSKPKGFDGAARAGAPLSPEDFRVDAPTGFE